MQRRLAGLFVGAMVFVMPGNVMAAFQVDVRTTTTPAVDTFATRLFNSSGGPASEIGDGFWLVVDTAQNGVPFLNATPGSSFDSNTLLGPDDFLIQGSVGTPLPVAGRYAITLTFDESLQTGGTPPNQAGGTVKPTYALLFSGDVSDVGDNATFGVYDFTEGLIPDIGNAKLRISSDVSADNYNFAVVPEPHPVLYAGFGVAVLAFLRRRFSRA